LKGIIFPLVLSRTLRNINASREVEPFVGYGISTVAGPLALAICLWISTRLPLPGGMGPSLVVPVALFTIMTGLFLIVSRRKALTQVLGYLVLENGIYTFGAAVARKQPFLVETGILLDVFVAVFVMGIIIFHINREFDHIDTDQLSSLRS
jgi:hydrogenase-4 component E